MFDCLICYDKCTEKKKVSCPKCQGFACKNCIKDHLLHIEGKERCFNPTCNMEWNRVFCINNLNLNYVTKILKPKKENYLLNREKSKFPEIIHKLEDYKNIKMLEKKSKEIRTIMNSSNNKSLPTIIVKQDADVGEVYEDVQYYFINTDIFNGTIKGMVYNNVGKHGSGYYYDEINGALVDNYIDSDIGEDKISFSSGDDNIIFSNNNKFDGIGFLTEYSVYKNELDINEDKLNVARRKWYIIKHGKAKVVEKKERWK